MNVLRYLCSPDTLKKPFYIGWLNVWGEMAAISFLPDATHSIHLDTAIILSIQRKSCVMKKRPAIQFYQNSNRDARH